MDKSIKLTLTLEATQFLADTLGKLPTASGAWPLLMEIKSQAEVQLGEPVVVDEETEEPEKADA